MTKASQSSASFFDFIIFYPVKEPSGSFAFGGKMANEENLKGHGFHERTASEQREIARQGGIRSGEVRRENKLIKDRILERMGASDWDEYIDGIIARAKDSTQGAEFFRDTIGEKPKDSLKVQGDNIEIRIHNAG